MLEESRACCSVIKIIGVWISIIVDPASTGRDWLVWVMQSYERGIRPSGDHLDLPPQTCIRVISGLGDDDDESNSVDVTAQT